MSTNLVGGLNPPCNPGIERPNTGINLDKNANTRHHPDTNANCRRATVIGHGKAFRMDLVEVFESADERYLHLRTSASQSSVSVSQIAHSQPGGKKKRTI
jgi:hypothetical protein